MTRFRCAVQRAVDRLAGLKTRRDRRLAISLLLSAAYLGGWMALL